MLVVSVRVRGVVVSERASVVGRGGPWGVVRGSPTVVGRPWTRRRSVSGSGVVGRRGSGLRCAQGTREDARGSPCRPGHRPVGRPVRPPLRDGVPLSSTHVSDVGPLPTPGTGVVESCLRTHPPPEMTPRLQKTPVPSRGHWSSRESRVLGESRGPGWTSWTSLRRPPLDRGPESDWTVSGSVSVEVYLPVDFTFFPSRHTGPLDSPPNRPRSTSPPQVLPGTTFQD